jgi:hypothetical protein
MQPGDIEQQRQALAAELAADAGPDWPVGFRPGSPGCHELLDRTALLVDLLERHVQSHPACVVNPAWYARAERAAAALRELYQCVGADHLASDPQDSRQGRPA